MVLIVHGQVSAAVVVVVVLFVAKLLLRRRQGVPGGTDFLHLGRQFVGARAGLHALRQGENLRFRGLAAL